MGKMTCRRFVQYLLKMINLIFALIGLTMIGYGIYMIFSYNASSSSSSSSSSTISLSAQSLISPPSDCNYLEYKTVDKNSNIRKCTSQKCVDSCLFAWFWSDLPSAWFWYLFIIAGAVIIFITCSRYIAAATANGCCLSSYSFIVGILVVVEIAIVALIFYDSSWQDLMSDDSTGESDSIEIFIAWKMKNFKQAALAVVFLQASACGSLMYAMVATGPDIAHAVDVGSKFMANLGRARWEAFKYILRYLKGTKGKFICYGKGSLELKGYCDSDVAGDVDTRQVAMYIPLDVELFSGALDFIG